jgi:Putative transposase DNA-binding domain
VNENDELRDDDLLVERASPVSQLGSSAPLPIGSTPRPVAEPVTGHTGKAGEESPVTLGNRTQGAPTTAPSSDGSIGAAASGGGAGEALPASKSDPDKIVRQTTRFEINLRELSDHLNKDHVPGTKRIISPEEKELRNALWEASRLVTTVRNFTSRRIWRIDSTRLDDFLARNGHMPRKGDNFVWATPAELYSYGHACAVAPELATAITSSVTRDVEKRWKQKRFDILIRQDNGSAQQFNVGQPILIPAACLNIKVVGSTLKIAFALFSGKHEGKRRYTVTMVPRDNHQRAMLTKIASGEWRNGPALLQRDRLRPSRWYVRLAYTRLVPKRKEGIIAALNRGMRCFLVGVLATGESWIYDGNDIAAYLAQMQRRRKQYQRNAKASGRSGRGRRVILRPIKPLEGKAERWRQTKCQTIARRFAHWLADHGVHELNMEDFSGIRDDLPEKLEGGKTVWDRIQEWPFYQLGMRIRSCVEEEGITVNVLPASYDSQRCVQCGHVDEKNRNLAHWQLHCTKCGWRRHLDVANCMNRLARAQAVKSGETSEFDTLDARVPDRPPAARGLKRKPLKLKRSGDKGRKR